MKFPGLKYSLPRSRAGWDNCTGDNDEPPGFGVVRDRGQPRADQRSQPQVKVFHRVLGYGTASCVS